MSLARRGVPHGPLSEETKKKIGEAHKGRVSTFKGKHHSMEARRKMSRDRKGKKHKPHSEETKRKISRANKGRRRLDIVGEKNPTWNGGSSYQPYTQDWTDSLREYMRIRDGYTCQICGLHQDELTGWVKQLDVHHIDYDKENYDPENLISLCRTCHAKTNYNRDYWHSYFEDAVDAAVEGTS